jgi:hypothetical protein
MASQSSSNALGIVCLSAFVASTATAEPATPEAERASDARAGEPAADAAQDPAARADELIAEGVRLRREGKEREALLRFQQALELSPSARAHAQVALAMKSLRLYVSAERHLRQALAASQDAWIETNRATLEQALDFVDRQLAWLTLKTQLGAVELTLNGQSVGSVARGVELRVPAGELRLEIRAKGFQPKTLSVTANARRVTELELVLEPERKSEPPTVAGKSARAPETAPQTESAPLPAVAYVTAAVGIVGLGLGSYFGVRALELKDERDALCPEPRCSSERGVDLDREGRTAATLSTVGFAVGAAAVLATGYLVLFRPERASQKSASHSRLDLTVTRERAVVGYAAAF